MFIRQIVRLVGGLASASSRQFERGSKSGALAGMFFGIGAGIAAVLVLKEADTVDKAIARAVIFGVLFGFVGALLGSKLGRQPSFGDGAIEVEFGGARAVRITRLNYGLVPFVFFLGLLGALLVLIHEGFGREGGRESLWIVVVLLGIAAAVALFAAGCSILWFDIGPMGFAIFRLFRRTIYPFTEIEVCGFEVNQKLLLSPRIFTNIFRLRFRDGWEVTLNVPSYKAAPLAKVFLDNDVRDGAAPMN